MLCDMCGKDTKLFRTSIEGTTLNVCKECSKYGSIKAPVKEEVVLPKKEKKVFVAQPHMPEVEVIEIIVENIGEIIKQKREKLGLKQEELAKKINEKESIIQKIESGSFEPSLELAKKFERFLNVKLIEEHEEKKFKKVSGDKQGLTIGDLIKIKKK